MLFTSHSNIKRKNLSTSPLTKDSSVDLILETGIILIQSNDPMSKLIQYITRQEYSLIGIYRKTSNNDVKTTINIDLFNILSGETPLWLKDYKYLSDLETSKYIPKLIIYPTKDTFSLGIKPDEISIQQSLIYLFENIMELPLVKKISEALNVKTKDKEEKDNEKNKEEEQSGLEILIERSDMIDIARKRIVLNLETKTESPRFDRDRLYITKVIDIFTSMILADTSLIDRIVGKYLNKVYPYDRLLDIVDKHATINREVVYFFETLCQNGSIDKQTLTSLIDKINNNEKDEKDDKDDKDENALNFPDKLIVIDKTPSSDIKLTIKILHDQISRIVKTVEMNEIPHIELNKLISSLNDISDYYNINSKINPLLKHVSGVIIVSPVQDQSIHLTLKKGNSIILTTNNFDLSIFTRSELIEILEHIDRLVSDDRFDRLRREITKEILKR